MFTSQELETTKQWAEQRMAHLHGERDRVVIVDRVYAGRGVHEGTIRAKVIDDTRILYVSITDLEVF